MTLATHARSVFLFWLAASLVISPFIVFPLVNGAGFHDNQRLVEVSCVLLALAVISCQLMDGSSLPLLFSRPIAILLALFFLLGLVSSSTAYSPRHAFFEWANLLLLLGIAWLIASVINAKGDMLLDQLLMMGGLACAAYLLLEIAIYISLLKAGVQPSPSQLIVGFGNYRFFNHVQTTSLPLLGLLAARMRDPNRKVFWWVITALWWMLLFVGLGRGTLMGLVAGVAMTWLLMRGAAAPWCRAMLLAGLVGLVAYVFFYAAIPLAMGMEPFGLFFSSVERSVENPTSGRLQLWVRALEMVQANPWLGAGPVHFAHYGRDIPSGNAHPHNWMLQIGSEWGIPALLLLVGAVALAMHRLWQLRTVIAPEEQDTLTAWLVAGWAILVDGLVSGLIVMPTSQLWIALYIGCAWGWAASRSPSFKTTTLWPPVAGRIAIALVAPLLVYALLHGVWPELQEKGRKPLDSKEAVYRPRIWLDGRF